MGLGIPIIDGVLDIANKLIPDPEKRYEFQLELAKLADAENARASAEALAQSNVNAVEAGNRSVFVAGWRPFIGWVCGGGLLYSIIISPLFHTPSADLGVLQTILLAMLGISASRTVEKIKGVTNDILPILPPKTQVPAPIATPQPPKKKILGVAWPF